MDFRRPAGSGAGEDSMKRSCLALMIALTACTDEKPQQQNPPPAKPPVSGPDRLVVQILLVSYKDALPKSDVKRSKDEARVVAQDLYTRARGGDDFAELVRKNSDDDPLGIVQLVNAGVAPKAGDAPREQMVKPVGDLAFSLKPGEVGITESQGGWYIVKRLDDSKIRHVEHVTVQHILISFEGANENIKTTRSKAVAESLAHEILEGAKKGEDFGKLTNKFSDDDPVGIYSMANLNVSNESKEMPRQGMVKGFGNVAFLLDVGEVGLAEYNKDSSPYGWHIIKRLK
jgi:parvulin-like peptidyl-prolyl isomerase